MPNDTRHQGTFGAPATCLVSSPRTQTGVSGEPMTRGALVFDVFRNEGKVARAPKVRVTERSASVHTEEVTPSSGGVFAAARRLRRLPRAGWSFAREITRSAMTSAISREVAYDWRATERASLATLSE